MILRDRPLGWALIGCGGAGRAHTRGAVEDDDIVIRGFCDQDLAAAATLARHHVDTFTTTDPGRLFADPSIDVVSIATAHDSHADLAIAALRADKHVYLEKPMGMSSADCMRVEAARAAADRRLMLNFSIRFSNAARAIRARLGRVRVSHGQCTQPPADLSLWRWHPTIGGGPLYDVGVHALDLVCWMHDSDPAEIFATGGQVTHPGELAGTAIVDTVAATLRFVNASVATFLMTDAGRSELVSKWFFEFFDGVGSAVLHEHFGAASFTGPGADTGDPLTETIRPEPAPRFRELVAAIRSDSDPSVGPRDGIRSARLVEAIEQSVRTGQPQRIVADPG